MHDDHRSVLASYPLFAQPTLGYYGILSYEQSTKLISYVTPGTTALKGNGVGTACLVAEKDATNNFVWEQLNRSSGTGCSSRNLATREYINTAK